MSRSVAALAVVLCALLPGSGFREGEAAPPSGASSVLSGVAVPTLLQHLASSANPEGIGIPGNAFTVNLPNPVRAGNCLVLGITYPFAAGRAVTVADNNRNAWPSAPAARASRGVGYDSAVYVLPNANAGGTRITVTFDAAVIPFQFTVSEFDGVATVSPVSGSSQTAFALGPNLSSGTFTPGNNDAGGGNLVWAYFAPALVASSNPTTWTAGTNFDLLDADIAWNTNQGFPHASEYFVQTLAAPINPSIRATDDAFDFYNSVSVALRAKPAGTAPPSGVRIVRVNHMTSNVPPANATWKLQFPTSGNLIVLATHENFVIDVASVTDSAGNVYTKREPDPTEPQIWHTANSTASNALMITLTISGTPATATIVAYDVAGADPNPFDVAAGVPSTAVGSSLTHISDAPVITPTTPGGLVIAVTSLGQGPGRGLDVGAPAGASFDLATYAGETDLDLMENADLKGHLNNPDTATEHWNWVITATGDNSFSSVAVAFKGGPALPTTFGDCKRDGWQRFAVFKNEGDCVSFVATRGRNSP